jgi:hypothetical protein
MNIVLAAATAALVAAAPHSYQLTYRDFGPVTASSAFQPADGYAIRFEGCYAKHSAEAICGFTLRAERALQVTNIANLSHGSGEDGAPKRTCCIFLQGDPKGYPITPAPQAPDGTATLAHALKAGEAAGFMLRVPNYAAGAPLKAIIFSRGEGDPGVSFPATVQELP